MKRPVSRLIITIPATLTAAIALVLMWAVGFGWPWPEHWRVDVLSAGMMLTAAISILAALNPDDYPWEE